MADTTGNDFSVFDQNAIFNAIQMKEIFQEIVDLEGELITEVEKESELREKKKAALDYGLTLMVEEESVRKRILDTNTRDNGVISSTGEKLKNIVGYNKDIFQHREAVASQEKIISTLQKEQKDLKEQGLPENKEYEKHLAKTIRDNQMDLKLTKMRGQAMLNAHPFGPKMAKLMSGRGAMAVMGIAGMLAKVAGTIFGVLKKLVMGVFSAFSRVLSDVWRTWLEIQKLTGNIAADMGQTYLQTQQINNNIAQIAISAHQWGSSLEEALSFMTKFSEITGRNRVFLKEEVMNLTAIAKATGLGADLTGQMYAQMELLGYSTATFRGYVERTRKTSGELGLNITKVLKTVQQLLPAYNALNFKGGVDSLTEMVIKAQGVRFELNNMRSLAVQVFTPEGAIELAAKLRILGGEYAKIADPLGLMLKGQTDPQGLVDDILKTISNVAVRGTDGFFHIPPVQQALIREFAQMTGESVDNLTSSALEMRKQGEVVARLSGSGFFNQQDMESIARLTEWDAEKQDYMIRVDMVGTRKAISEINSSFDMSKQLMGMVRTEQELATNRMDLVEQLKNIYKMFIYGLQPIFRPLEAFFRDSGFMAKLQKTFAEFGRTVADKLVPMLGSGGAIYERMMKLGKDVGDMLDTVAESFSDKKSIVSLVSTFFYEVLMGIWGMIQPVIAEFAGQVGGSGFGKGIRNTARLGGAIGGGLMGAQLGMMAGPWGALIGAALGGLGGYLGGNYLGNQVAPANDFVWRDGQVQHFNKDDIIYGATKPEMQPSEKSSPMVSSRTLLEQTKTYEKSSFSPLNAYSGGGEQKKSTPENIQLNMSGSIEIKGDDNSVYLTNTDLKNVGIQHLTYLILNETDRYRNHASSKRLTSELIKPIK